MMNKIIEVEVKREEWPNGHKIWRGLEVTDEIWKRVEAQAKYAIEGLIYAVIEDAIKEEVKVRGNPNHHGDWLVRELARISHHTKF